MKCKFFSLSLLVTIIVAYIIRFAIINTHEEYPKDIIYNIGDEVQFEKDYFDNSNNCSNGYSIAVSKTELVKSEDFISRYGFNESELRIKGDYVFLVKAKYSNNLNIENKVVGIDLSNFLLQETSYISLADRESIHKVNDFNVMKFSLKPKTSKEIILPFIIDTKQIDIKRIKRGKPYLVVSLYPNKKKIALY